MAAFGPNAMLHAQFPTPIIRQELQKSIENKALADIDDSKTTVLVVTGSKDKEKNADIVIAFAKWSHPVLPGEDYMEPAWVWPEGTDLKVLEAWTAKAAEAESRSIGDAPCYRLTFIGTDPAYGHQGAGHLLLKWGIEQCHGNGSPLYLESCSYSMNGNLNKAPRFGKVEDFNKNEYELYKLHSRIDGIEFF
ncbi:hypothetical protein CORC01_08724 [Colletotrichum orchidophilum]|uniref:N-acetyltransferase domain-containing protein n=1 Tax=Colletotrichum orchidophilum TaxID=1209926 RepID=A0A1G4B3Q5_9PEZI|nr:uncharacterized protein CORC01_08724 [Colletotrichum orchidophilum]OHE96031.1 hypothetical protein CORC01_08724 [Colletotrichum orchidophilum]